MTHQEKARILKQFTKLADGWKSDFIVSQFQHAWSCQRELEEDLKKSGYTLLQITEAVQPYLIRRQAFVAVLKRRGDI